MERLTLNLVVLSFSGEKEFPEWGIKSDDANVHPRFHLQFRPHCNVFLIREITELNSDSPPAILRISQTIRTSNKAERIQKTESPVIADIDTILHNLLSFAFVG